MGPRTSESGPSLTSAMPTSLPPQSALSRLAPGQQGGISWPFAMPLGETCHIVILDPLRFPKLAGARSTHQCLVTYGVCQLYQHTLPACLSGTTYYLASRISLCSRYGLGHLCGA